MRPRAKVRGNSREIPRFTMESNCLPVGGHGNYCNFHGTPRVAVERSSSRGSPSGSSGLSRYPIGISQVLTRNDIVFTITRKQVNIGVSKYHFEERAHSLFYTYCVGLGNILQICT